MNKNDVGTDYDPNSFGAATGQGILAGLGAASGGAALAGATEEGTITNSVGQALASQPIKSAALGVPMSITGKAAENITPEPYKPYANMAAQLATGLGAAGVSKLAGMAGNAIGDKVSGMGFAPKEQVTPEISATQGQQRAAGQRILSAAKNPENVSLNSTPSNVEGVQPTLAESLVNPNEERNVGDTGISEWQRNLKTKNSAPFLQRERDNLSAQNQSINQLGGTGDANKVGHFVTDHLQANDAAAEAEEQRLSANLGNEQQAANEKIASIGRYGETPTEGATNDTILNARAVRDEQASKIWDTLKPLWNSPADLVTPRNAAQDLLNKTNEYGAVPLHPAEKQVTDSLLNPPAEADDSLLALKRFRTMVGEAQRSLPRDGSQATVMGRLQNLKDSIDEGVNNTVNGNVLRNEDFYSARDFAVDQIKDKGEGNVIPDSPHSGFTQSDLKNYQAARQQTFENKTIDQLERGGAISPDGTIDPKKFDKEMAKEQMRQKLQHAPKLNSDLQDARESISNVEQAQSTLNDYRAQRTKSQQDFQKSQAAKFIDSDPVKAVKSIWASKNPEKEFAKLVDMTKGDADASAGLKRAVTDHILQEIRKSNAGDTTGLDLANPKKFRDFLTKNKRALIQIYGGQGVNNLEMVAADMRRSAIPTQSVKIGGQSNTTQDILNAGKQQGGTGTVMGLLREHGLGMAAKIGAMAEGHPALAVALHIGGSMVNGMKQAGVKTINDLELEAALHPELAKTLMSKAKSLTPLVQKRIGSQLTTLVPPTVATSQLLPKTQENGKMGQQNQ